MKFAFTVTLSALSSQSIRDPHLWFVDSGASTHMSPQREFFADYERILPVSVCVANGDILQGVGRGTICFLVEGENGKEMFIEVKDVLHVPELSHSLYSIPRASENGVKVTFGNGQCRIVNYQGVVLPTISREGLFLLNARVSVRPDEERTFLVLPMQQWHEILGHISTSRIQQLAKMANGIQIRSGSENFNCEICPMGKATAKPISSAPAVRSDISFGRVHSDLSGPHIQSLGGAHYFATFTDDFSRYTWLYFLKRKSDLADATANFFRYVTTQFGQSIKILRSDQGGEYKSDKVRKILAQYGTIHEFSAPYTPEHNRVAERKNRTLVSIARCMLQQAQLGKGFWAEALTYTNLITNCTPSSAVPTTPFEAFFGYCPDISHFRTFGSRTETLIQGQHLRKFDSRTKSLVYLGPSVDSSGHRLWDPITKCISINRNVSFVETFSSDPLISKTNTVPPTIAPDFDEDSDSDDDDLVLTKPYSPIKGDVFIPDISLANTETPSSSSSALPAPRTDAVSDTDLTSGTDSDDDLIDSRFQRSVGGNVSSTNTVLPIPSLAQGQPISSVSDTPADSTSGRPVRIRTPTWKIRENAMFIHTPDPLSHLQALSSPDSVAWNKAMDQEYSALIRNNTWELVSKPPGKRVIGVKWVFKTKYGSDGEIERYKARLVAKGFNQVREIDFYETYAPTARMTSL